ncbi:hypothetical protein HYDPIDRAFT_182819 [Hydnomerulius pinastri MD-312]|uniref:Pentafunctional AROM polypeptide n=1 Tax=Hydnomerulius pinastri MD-312 TaxID=994086 RepID=A0A0C9V984_9AGAM|nr:hypothetical protein HYDPIDRAFT_182819 [Hydnomerulius pinastri MD-312]
MSAIHKISILGKESIHCGFNLIPHISNTLLTTLPSSTYVLITDTNIAPLYLQPFIDQFTSDLSNVPTAPRFITHIVPPGETTKSREGKAEIEDFLLSQKCTRDTVILALGGGVIGDLVGFVAATFMRGVRFVQIPTSLLAMVDSSVGGKTAIDTPLGKNLIGAFHQPEYIFIDAAFLATLPKRELANGLAEVIKTAAIWDEDAFALLESSTATLLDSLDSLHPSASHTTSTTAFGLSHPLLSLIISSITTKSTIVTYDPREAHLRNLVNFGHTLGHAIEAFLTPYLLHGECISVGMILEAELARMYGPETGLGQVGVGRLRRCVEGYGLPTSLTHPMVLRAQSQSLAAGGEKMTLPSLLAKMAIDKKNSSSRLKKVVLLSRIGKVHELRATGVPDEEIAKVLCAGVRVVAGTPGGYVRPALPEPLRELPGVEGPVPPQMVYPPSTAPSAAPSPANGVPHITLSTPGSKSISNRALVLAALSGGTVKLKNLLHSDDTQVMMAALEGLKAASFEWTDNGETLVVTGNGGNLSLPPAGTELYLGNAGTAARFLTTVCTLVPPPPPSAQSHPTVITGNARMRQRPIAPLVSALTTAGAQIRYLGTEGCLPLAIAPTGLPGGTLELDASISSQYVSSILLCAPYAAADTTLVLTGPAVISQLYIDMTIALMRDFGVHVTRGVDPTTGLEAPNVYHIPRGTYTPPSTGEFTIESDASSATYPLAIAAATGTSCTLSSIGSSSLQGDARFAVDVLRPLGCTVVQTPTSTTVTGPPRGRLCALGGERELDMEPMTDAFLTAAVLGAVATRGGAGEEETEGGKGNTMRIRGIANQRVKECNRIQAMMDQLAKFGIKTTELPDGLEIHGRPLSSLKNGASIHCYDDHRVAMAFSVLATVVDGTIIEEKRCVEKTWPNWWDDLENKLGIKVIGVDIPTAPTAVHSSPVKRPTASASQTPSVLLIGMRGSGKSHIGLLASQSLSLPLLDIDAHFSSVHPPSLRAYVQTHGWPAFRAAETALLLQVLSSHKTGWVISLGGGIVETPEAREALVRFGKEGGTVVWVQREMEEIERVLEGEGERPAYGESVRSVFERREPWFEQCANYEFGNYTKGVGSTEGGLDGEIGRFFGHVSGTTRNLVPRGQGRSYFLSLTYPDIVPALPSIPELSIGVDALELRVDLLSEPGSSSPIPSHAYVSHQVSALRRVTSLPVVFTVRTVSQGGAFPDTATAEAVSLLKLALRLGVEYIDVETTLPPALIKEVVSAKGHSQIIASFHDWSGTLRWDTPSMSGHYAVAAQYGDIVKLISKATTFADNFTLQSFVAKHTSAPGSKPLIAINMGVQGQLSRVLNKCFTPVTHPLLPSKAAPGQLSFVEIQQALHLSGLLPAKQFYLFGTPIAHSMSPTLHNTAFTTLGLPHTYSLLETSSVGDEIKEAIKRDDFGGASVTIPFKLDVMPLLDALSPAAHKIGAVNTILPLAGGKLYGDNTDYLGIAASIRTRVPALGAPSAALVIGAGGTARAAIYALQTIGTKHVYVFNRTAAKAEALASAFDGGSGARVAAVGELGAWDVAPSVIVSTVPADATTLVQSSSSSSAVYLPPTLFDTSLKGVVIDMAYKPSRTPLLALAEDAAPGWARVRGVEVLLEQGYVQFEKWTGRRCPRETVRERVLEKYDASA